MNDCDLAWRIEAACRDACPSPRDILLQDRWLVRLAGGATRRVNSVNPLCAEADDPAPVIDAARRLYAAHGRPLVFRAPTIVHGLDTRLEQAGFSASGMVSTLVGSTDAGVADGAVALAPAPNAAWYAAKFRMSPNVGATPGIYRTMMVAISIPKAFAALSHEDRIVAVAYGAIQEGILVLEAVVTDPAARRRGYGRRLVAAVMAWARARGAPTACLQVESDNLAAVALYRTLGFATDLYRYRYFSEA